MSQSVPPGFAIDASGDRLVVERVFRASPATVFDAFTQKLALAAWWGPDPFHFEIEMVDAREGGSYRFRKVSTEGAEWILSGRYLTFDPPHHLAFTWRWKDGVLGAGEMLVDIHLSDHPDGTALKLIHTGFENDAVREQHQVGWCASLACLDDHLMTPTGEEETT